MVVSQYTILPWESQDEYRVLLEALVAEHDPKGPTEEHCIEELAGVIWRKRRLRLGEAAAYNHGLLSATEPYQYTARAALVHVAEDVEQRAVNNAIIATEEQVMNELAALQSCQAITEKALRVLAKPNSASAYSKALAVLHQDTRSWWQDQLACDPEDHDEDETPYKADAESLARFLQSEVLPWYENRRRELAHRSLLRSQAFGEAADPSRLGGLAWYEVHLDRKLERVLAMLFRLQELRRDAEADKSVSQK
jgi:hypothetical protein